jgi:hypothetical protein
MSRLFLGAKDHRITAQDLTDMKTSWSPKHRLRVLKVYQSRTDARVSALDYRPKDWLGTIDNERNPIHRSHTQKPWHRVR